MKLQNLGWVCILSLMCSCTLAPLRCLLSFDGYEKTYTFSCGKAKLKDRIIDAYTYDCSTLAKNAGLTLIESAEVNAKYRQSTEIWLDKTNWDGFRHEIRLNTADTLQLIIGKHHSRTEIRCLAIVDGNATTSSLTITDVHYHRKKACRKASDHYLVKVSDRIDRKLIDQLQAE